MNEGSGYTPQPTSEVMREDMDVVTLASHGVGLSERLCQLCFELRLWAIRHNGDVVALEAAA